MTKNLNLFNTLSNKKEKFVPIDNSKVGMYVCGPTVYSNVHLGNCRTFISFDLIYGGFEKIKSIEPEKNRTKPTLNYFQKHFHLAQRSVASKGYLETITWSFTDEKINNKFKEKNRQ